VATIQDQARPTPAGKYDGAVEAHLARARRRIRSLDTAVGVLVLVSGTLAFTLLMVLCDRWLVLSPLTRQLALAGYVLAALAYLVFGLLLPLCRRINPYFAARHLEQVVPGAKNSVVNWLDLRGEPLPPAIRNAVGQRAARDLQQADLEEAISGRRAAWLGGLTGILALAAFVALLLLGARPFFSLLGRAFAPFTEGVIATRTRLTLLEPEGGNAIVAVGRSVRFRVEVDGRVPDPGKSDALRLLFHYQQGDPYEDRPLERDAGAEWTTTLPAFQVQNGFWYKVAGGDTETAEYRVQVRATPLIEGFEATYHYRPYLGWRDDTTRDPNLRSLRGTEVALVAHTNRTVRVKDSRLELELAEGAKKVVPAEAVADDPQAFLFRLVLDESGKYRVWFTSAEGESNTDPPAYTVQVLTDHEPRVELTKPGQNVTLPANGVLRLEGLATDDIGLKGMTLQMQVKGGPKLRAKPYREGKSFRLEDGGYPTTLRYKDFVELASVQDPDGKPVTLRPKTEVEYWLEATDDCDFPGPNVGKSDTYKLTIADPETDKAKEGQERKKAEEEQKQHEAKQDEQLQKENETPRPDTNPDHARQEQNRDKQQDKKDRQDKGGQQQGNQDKQDKDREQQGNQEGQRKDQQDKGQQGEKPEQKQGQQGKGSQDKGGGRKDAGEKGGAGQNGENKQGGEQQGDREQGGADGANQAGQQDQREQQAQKLAEAIKKEQQQRGGNQGGAQPGAEKAGNDSPKNGNPGADKTPKAGDSAHPGQPQPAAGNDRTGQQPPPDKGPPNAADQGTTRPQPGAERQGERTGEKTPGQGEAAGEKPMKGGSNGESRPMPGANQERPNPEAGAAGGDKAQHKPNQEKSGTSGAASSQEKSNAGEKDPAQMNAEDVRRLSEKAGNGDQRERAEAAKRLEQASREAKDPAARDAARKALAEQGQREKKEESPASAKSGPKESEQRDAQNEGRPGECKNCSGGKPGAGGGKGAGGSPNGQTPQGTAKDEGGRQTAQGGNPNQPNGNQGEGTPAGSAKGRGDRILPDGTPGSGGGGGHVSTNEPAPGGEDQPPDRSDAPKQSQRAGELVLEDLRKTVEELKKHPEEMKKVLDRAGLKEKDLRNVEQYLDEKLPAPQQGGSLGNLGARKVAPGQGKAPDTKVNGPALPPPGFRDSTREFTRKLAEPEKDQ
jgi:hypothetical protein